ncbi:MAG: S-adenosylmethionine:tRNA ribosyltransferase-isomerase, partial [Myxococcota bacterium]
EAMYRASKPLKPGQLLVTDVGEETIEVVENPGGGIVHLKVPDDSEAFVTRAGQIPLPPYIDRAVEASDTDRYQTVYAAETGAVAAPTAGLHFTDDLMDAMRERGAVFATVTLHVGPGTFRPIRVENIEDHTLHTEHWTIDQSAADAINAAKRVVAVGTTSVRTLETAATGRGTVAAGSGDTGLYITPGYEYKVVEALLTNFHLPGSSLLVLVGAFCGVDAMMAAYQRALDEQFRFYSYGDAMFISSPDSKTTAGTP